MKVETIKISYQSTKDIKADTRIETSGPKKRWVPEEKILYRSCISCILYNVDGDEE